MSLLFADRVSFRKMSEMARALSPFNGFLISLTDQKGLWRSLIFVQLYDNYSRLGVILIFHNRLAFFWYQGKYSKFGHEQRSAKTEAQQVWSIQFIFYVIIY